MIARPLYGSPWKGKHSMTPATRFENYFHILRDVIRAMHSITNLQEVLNMVVTKTTGALLRIRAWF